MTKEQLQQLADEYLNQQGQHLSKFEEAVCASSYKDGFKRALEIVFNRLDAPLYTHYDYDAALKPLLNLYESLTNK